MMNYIFKALTEGFLIRVVLLFSLFAANESMGVKRYSHSGAHNLEGNLAEGSSSDKLLPQSAVGGNDRVGSYTTGSHAGSSEPSSELPTNSSAGSYEMLLVSIDDWYTQMTTETLVGNFNVQVVSYGSLISMQLMTSTYPSSETSVYNKYPIQRSSGFLCSFQISMSGGYSGFDMFFYAGAAAPVGCGVGCGAGSSSNGGVVVGFYVFPDFTGLDLLAPSIYLKDGTGMLVAAVPFSGNGVWETVTIAYSPGVNDTWVVTWKGNTVLTYSDLNNLDWVSSAHEYWGFGANGAGVGGYFYISQVEMSLQSIPPTMNPSMQPSSLPTVNSTQIVSVMVLSSIDTISSTDNCRPGFETTLCTLRTAISYCAQVNEQTALICDIVLAEVGVVSITSGIVMSTASSTLQLDLSITGNGATIECALNVNGNCPIPFLIIDRVLNSFAMTNVTVMGFAPNMQMKSSALYIEAISSVSITGVEFVNNVGDFGGSVHIDSTSQVSIEKCSFTDNSALVSGGSLYISHVSSVEIKNTVFRRNRAIPVGSPGLVTTLAGSDRAYGLTDGSGTEALFNYPFGVAFDAYGNVFVADQMNNRIRIVSPAGDVSTIPFNFNLPRGVALDAEGNVIVADSGNNRICKISLSGVVTTLAGHFTAGNGDGAGTSAGFNYPSGVAVDDLGNVVVADSSNNLIRVISSAGFVTTLAGHFSFLDDFADGIGTTAFFKSPTSVAFDARGNVVVADFGNNMIRLVSPIGLVTTLQTNTQISPICAVVDKFGNILMADFDNHMVRAVSPAGIVMNLAGDGSIAYADGVGPQAKFNHLTGLAVDTYGNIAVADPSNNVIRFVSPTQSNGGAVFIDSVSSIRVSNCSFLENSAAGSGGAVHVSNSKRMVVDSSFIASNQAQLGGGVSFICTSCSSSRGEMYRSQVEGNHARNAGGGIATGMSVRLFNTSVRDNQVFVGVRYSNSSRYFTGQSRGRGIERGGGIYVYSTNASVILEDVVVAGNRAGDRGGGALHVDSIGNSIFISNSTVESNTASGSGAGICIDAPGNVVDVVDTVIASNTIHTYDNDNMPSSDIGNGGGIFLNGNGKNVNLTRCLFTGNSAQKNGGGLYQAYAEDSFELNVLNCTFLGNTGSNGGAVAFGTKTASPSGPSLGSCKVTIDESTFDHNSAIGNGGGLYFPSESGSAFSVEVSSSRILSNKASGNGGGLYTRNDIDIYDTVISRGIANAGGGMYIGSGFSGTVCNLVRVQVLENEAVISGGGVFVADKAGDVSFIDSSLDDNRAASGGGIACGAPGSNQSYIFKKSNVRNNVAVNGAGLILSSSTLSAEQGPVLISDCRVGNNFATISGGGVFIHSSIVKIFFLSAQISNNSAQNGGGLYLTPFLENLYWIDGSFTANSASVSGGGVYIDRSCRNISFLHVLWQSNSAVRYGGGIYVDSRTQSITVSRCELYRNVALNGGAVAMISFNNEFSIHDSYIVDNAARYSGGGVYISNLNTNIVMYNCSYLRNVAVTGDGGAVLIDFANSEVSLSRCSFIGNHAAVFGGGVSFVAQNQIITIDHSTFQSNIAYAGGGLTLYRDSSNVTITHTIFEWNNVTTIGGSIYISLDCSDLYISSTAFSENSAVLNGGAMYVDRATINMMVSNSFFRRNTVNGDGGAVYISQYNSHVSMQSIVFDGNSALGSGGGVSLDSFNDATFENCTFSNQVANSGGGLYGFSRNAIMIMSCKFLKNSVLTESGGGLSFEGHASVLVYSSLFTDNTAVKFGGAISLISGYSNITVHSCTFIRNRNVAGSGGSIYVFGGGAVRIVDSSCTHSVALLNGGCFYVSTTSLVRIDNAVISDGVSGTNAVAASVSVKVTALDGTSSGATTATGVGGALCISECNDVLVSRSMLTNSVAESGGAGAFLTDCPKASLRNCTFSGNICPKTASGSALYIAASNLTVDKLRFAGNGVAGGGAFFWDASTMSIPSGTESSIWLGTSLEPSVSTSVTRITSPHSVFVSRRYASSQQIPHIIVTLYDYYGQIMRNENSAVVSVNLTNIQGCKASSEPLIGTVNVIVTSGQATFSTLTSDCEPEGVFTLSFVLQNKMTARKFSCSTLVYFPTYSPTISPTKQPIPEAPPLLTTSGEVGVCVTAAVVVLILVAYYIYNKRLSDNAKRKVESKNRLRQLPLHRFLLVKSRRIAAVTANDDQILSLIVDYPEHIREIDFDGRTPLDIILSKKHIIPISSRSVVGLLNADITALVAPELSGNEWCKAVQSRDEMVVSAVREIVHMHKPRITFLANCQDVQGRCAKNIAGESCKEVVLKALYLHGRYEVKAGPPEHQSATSLVVFALDHKGDVTSGNGDNVALKFMKHRDQFLKEVNVRSEGGFDAKFVLPITCSYDGDSDEPEARAFREDAVLMGYEDYKYCVVMEAASRSLMYAIDHDQVVGNDWDRIKIMSKQLASALDHVHSKGIVHGDIKPLNVLMVNDNLKLTDLDAACNMTKGDCAGEKYSSGYLAPELLWRDEADGAVQVRSRDGLSTARGQYELLPANPSQDMWALGCVLYTLCCGSTLFQTNTNDNMSFDDDLTILFEWTAEVKEKKLSLIKDKLARNLLSLLLSKDPSKRPSASRVLDHPFLTGKAVVRLQGEEAAWDVFLSYRVSSDSNHVEMLYNALTEKKLKVWWDKLCLLPGQNWEEGFCRGLMSSGCFVCLASRGAMKNATNDSQNWEKLTAASRCDNVLLEWRLALDLKERDLLHGVFPVMIGDKDDLGLYGQYRQGGCRPSPPDVVVASVETKVREHLDREGLGSPYRESMSVKAVLDTVMMNQGSRIVGDITVAVDLVANEILKMVQTARSGALPETVDNDAPIDVKEVDLKSIKYTILSKDKLIEELSNLRDRNKIELENKERENETLRDLRGRDENEIMQLRRMLEEVHSQTLSRV